MKSLFSRILPTLLTTLFLAAGVHAGTLSGTVINRTTGKPAANVDLDLLSPTAGMAEVAATKSDAQGRFSVTKDAIGMGPILIRATYHDTSFNTFAPPGRPEVEVEVYEISKDPKTISVESHVIIFEPQDGKLVGAEEYSVQNASQPASAFFRTEGNFEFAIPEKGTLGPVTATTSMGVAVPQASIDKGKGHYAIAYPFRPGQTNVRLSYGLPYANNSATLKLPTSYPGIKLLVVVPPGVTITGDGLTAAGEEQGMMVYTHPPLPAKGILSVSLSGVAAPQPADAGQGQGTSQEGNSRAPQGPEVIAAPSRLDDYKWYIFAGLAALFAMGAILVSRKQVVVTGVDDDAAAPLPAKSAKSGKGKKAPPVAPTPAPNLASDIDQHVTVSMDSLKDQIFRLELRRQAGTISEEDYAREKALFEKHLRDLVKG
jgi:5-hydroxyisourate hydrolase-like protein (transthyretin family)